MTWFSFQNVYYTNCTDINQQIPANHDLSTDAIDWLHLIFTDHGISLPQLPPQAARLALLWPYQSCQHCSGGKIPNINVGCKFKRMASLWQSSFRLCCTARSMQKKVFNKKGTKRGSVQSRVVKTCQPRQYIAVVIFPCLIFIWRSFCWWNSLKSWCRGDESSHALDCWKAPFFIGTTHKAHYFNRSQTWFSKESTTSIFCSE